MHVIIVYPLAYTAAPFDGRGFAELQSGRSWSALMKMLIPLEQAYINISQHCPATGVQNADEASSSIILRYFHENAHNS